MIFLDFDPRNPPAPVYPFFLRGGVWGVKSSVCLVAAVCVFGPWSYRYITIFFLHMDPLPMAGVPGSNSGYP